MKYLEQKNNNIYFALVSDLRLTIKTQIESWFRIIGKEYQEPINISTYNYKQLNTTRYSFDFTIDKNKEKEDYVGILDLFAEIGNNGQLHNYCTIKYEIK